MVERKRQRTQKVCVLTGWLSFNFCLAVMLSQSTAQLSGTIKDQTGAVLPGVEVTLTHTDTGLKRSAVSDETGSYILTNLPVGPYRFEAALSGFRTYVQTGIVLQVNSDAAINPVLAIGQVTETVEVRADAALVETRNSGVGTVMDNQRVLELPLNGRQVTELIFLAGMANPGVANNGVRNYPTVAVSVAGGIGGGVAFWLESRLLPKSVYGTSLVCVCRPEARKG